MKVSDVWSGEFSFAPSRTLLTAFFLFFAIFFCIYSCLDDTELALLGVPWETYHCIATKIGLDVIR